MADSLSLQLRGLLETFIPDFVLAFAFFTSICYAVLGKRFEKQRPAIVISSAMGLALSVGLVWWERANGFSIKDLGPIAIGFAILLLAFVMHQSIKQVGGSWAGAGITIGACIFIAQLIGVSIPIDPQIIQTVLVVALLLGMIAFMSHCHARHSPIALKDSEIPEIKRSMADLYRQRHLSKKLGHGLREVRKESDLLTEHPKDAGNVLLQIKRLLPAQGHLTQRMAQLRTKAHQVKHGHIARLQETRRVFARQPTAAKKKASAELVSRYNQMVSIDTRLERLDSAVAENERRIKELTEQARDLTAKHEHRKLVDTLKAAERLQNHNTRLIGLIERTEHKLSEIPKEVAKEVKRFGKE